jgi:hypothetical protein
MRGDQQLHPGASGDGERWADVEEKPAVWPGGMGPDAGVNRPRLLIEVLLHSEHNLGIGNCSPAFGDVSLHSGGNRGAG